ncbi:MAG: 2-oxoacid:acceptor oxidoreductase subunit alpha [Rikenellaceae bacterium]
MENINESRVEDVVIRFSGDSGDGMQMTGTLFTDTSAYLGNGVSTFPDFPAEIRAPQGTVSGVSGFQVHFGCKKIYTPGDYCDVLVAMNPAALRANARWLKKSATVIFDSDVFTEKNIVKAGFATLDPFEELGITNYDIHPAPITSMTKEALKDSGLDNKSIVRCKNMFALGVCYFMYNRPMEYTVEFINKKFGRKPEIAAANITVLNAGYNFAHNQHLFGNTYDIPSATLDKGIYRNINGNQAAAWGFIAASEKSGRPLFCGSYPITPATHILEELAKRKDLGVKTLQAEDEIAGICTSIGAAFAGNFAVTTTSGPGLSLKSEAIGLAVMTELPLVIVDVQRGGPSTGLPTKTEQSDLNQALYGRNGECPLVVMTASTPSDCFHYAFWAGKIAMEHMTPVMLLTDGFIANGSEPWKIPSMSEYPEIVAPVIKDFTFDSKFMPYARDEQRLARKWALPGTLGVEHRIGGLEKDFLNGSVSHDPINHEKMVNIRKEKVEKVAEFIPEQEVIGSTDGGELLVVGWGGTYGHLLSAVEELREEGKDISLCHFNYIYPLPKNSEDILRRFKKIVVCELNLGQFASYLRQLHPDIKLEQLNKVQGLPFTVLELKEHFETLLNK